MKKVISICGSDTDDDALSNYAMEVAEQVGREIAKRDGVLLCGGHGGVMRAACRGAKEENGITVGIMPFSKDEANEFIDIAIPTTIGYVRNFIVANSGDSFHNASSYGYNLDNMAYYGAEFEFNTVLFEKLTLFGNYTFRKSDYDPDKLLADAILLELAPKHKANLGIRYSLFNGTMITSDIRFVGNRKTEGNVMNLGSFTTVDLGFQHAFSENIVLRVYGANILDKDYQEVYGFPMPGFTYGANLKMTF